MNIHLTQHGVNYLLDNVNELWYNLNKEREEEMIVFEPNADKRAVMEFEQNLGTYGLHEKCNRCSHPCIQYSAPNLYFYCADFTARILRGE